MRSIFLSLLLSCAPLLGSAHATIEYLYWKPVISGMSYAIVTDGLTLTSNPRALHHTFEWSSGVRLGVGYELPCLCSDLVFEWTHYTSENTASETGPIVWASHLFGVTANATIGGTTFDAGAPASAFSLYFDLFSLNYRYMLYTNSRLSFIPYIGVAGGRIFQEQKIKYLNFLNSVGAIPVNAIINETNHFYGAGPVGGFNNEFLLGWDVFLNAQIEGGILVGTLNCPARYFVVTPPGTVAFDFKYQNSAAHVIPMCRLKLGLNWEGALCYRFLVDLGISYEVEYFSDTVCNTTSNNQIFFVTNTEYGDQLLHGITVNAGLSF